MTVSGEPCPNLRCAQDHEADIIDTYHEAGMLRGHKLRCPDCDAVWVMFVG